MGSRSSARSKPSATTLRLLFSLAATLLTSANGRAVVTRSGPPTTQERQFWSFQPLNAALPLLSSPAEIDALIAQARAAHQLHAAPPAARPALIRRATYDLTGLPPTPREVAAFLHDDSPQAFEHVVDRLLASPSYGERFGRRWLDVVRYADTAGETADFPVREAWKYRNWVIDAFNRDEPYNEFIREQIAGDLLAKAAPPEQSPRLITATGYLAITRRFGFTPEGQEQLMTQDTIDNLGQTMLGLSLGCARCHDHKFDPITTADYYALYGIFASTTFAMPGCEKRPRPENVPTAAPPATRDALAARYTQQLAEVDAALAAKQAERVALVGNLHPAPTTCPAIMTPAETGDLRARLDALDNAILLLQRQRNQLVALDPRALVYGVSDGTPQNVHIQKRGDPLKLGDEVPRRFLEVLGNDPLPPDEKGSGRLELADWLTRPSNPLTARVMVNRIWQSHFGTGIVQSESDFGTRGMPPTHPELLDRLARTFIANGWSIKSMHRLMMLTSTYQLSSDFDGHNTEIDPDDNFLWRARRQRLDAEEMRDAMLAVADNLDRSPGGEHPFPDINTWGFSQHNPFYATYETDRRSVYLMFQRMQRHPYLELFDGADPNVGIARRDITIVPTQALFMMNSPFVHHQSEVFTHRLMEDAPDPAARIALTYQLTLARDPTPQESAGALQFIEQYRQAMSSDPAPADAKERAAWAGYLRTILCGNEFLFVD